MKTRILVSGHAVYVLLLAIAGLTAHSGESPYSATIPEMVRMSTHVVTGVATEVKVVDGRTGKEVTHPSNDLGNTQKLEIELEVIDVLQNSQIGSLRSGSKVRVLSGQGRFTMSVFRKALIARPSIYFLCWDAEHSPRLNYYFPFYGLGSMAVLPERREEVKAAIKGITDAAK